jgi:hypothetical protein
MALQPPFRNPYKFAVLDWCSGWDSPVANTDTSRPPCCRFYIPVETGGTSTRTHHSNRLAVASSCPALFRSGARSLYQLACGNLRLLRLRASFRRKEETWFRTRFPAEPTENLPHGFFAKAKPTRNSSVAHPLGFEAKNSPIPLMVSLMPGRAA